MTKDNKKELTLKYTTEEIKKAEGRVKEIKERLNILDYDIKYRGLILSRNYKY